MKPEVEKKNITYLERLIKKNNIDESLSNDNFARQAQYYGNNVYSWCGNYSTNTRELFLMGCLTIENIKFKK
jgi:hypothetical protein